MNEALLVFPVVIAQPGLDLSWLLQNRRPGRKSSVRNRKSRRPAHRLHAIQPGPHGNRATFCSGTVQPHDPRCIQQPVWCFPYAAHEQTGRTGRRDEPPFFSEMQSGSRERASRVSSLVPGQQTMARQAPGQGKAYSSWLPGGHRRKTAVEARGNIIEVDFATDAAFHICHQTKNLPRAEHSCRASG